MSSQDNNQYFLFRFLSAFFIAPFLGCVFYLSTLFAVLGYDSEFAWSNGLVGYLVYINQFLGYSFFKALFASFLGCFIAYVYMIFFGIPCIMIAEYLKFKKFIAFFFYTSCGFFPLLLFRYFNNNSVIDHHFFYFFGMPIAGALTALICWYFMYVKRDIKD